MRLLQGLRERSGITIILITHEAEIAAYGTRIISVRDGFIVSDTPNTPVTAALNLEGEPAAEGALA
jgi:putative ABC transport system ATP-binding protein